MPRFSRLSLVFTAALAVSLGSCTTGPTTNRTESTTTAVSPAASSDAPLRVTTTFLPITQFTRAVAGDRAEVTQLLPLNIGPHDYQAKPEDVQRLTQSQVLVKNGLGMEEFLASLIANAENADLILIDSSQGIATIANRNTDHSDHALNHEHEPDPNHGHDHDHEHDDDHSRREIPTDPKAGHDHHHHGEFNPHIWLDPKRAIQQVETIRDGLIQADPQGQPDYTANAARYIQQLRQLDAEITEKLQPYQGKTFVVFHDFAPYFAESYGLQAEFLVDIPETNPSPADVKRITDAVKRSDLNVILTEPQSGNKTFTTLAEDLNIAVSTFDPIETGGPDALQPEYYLTTMRQNVANLLTAFQGGNQANLALWSAPFWGGLLQSEMRPNTLWQPLLLGWQSMFSSHVSLITDEH